MQIIDEGWQAPTSNMRTLVVAFDEITSTERAKDVAEHRAGLLMLEHGFTHSSTEAPENSQMVYVRYRKLNTVEVMEKSL